MKNELDPNFVVMARITARDEFVENRKTRPYPQPIVGPEGEGADKQHELEQRYSATLPARV